MKAYTLGFIFNQGLSEVLLMHKNRPEWQVGRINGIGGKIEAGEESADCIVREVAEEAGVRISKKDWRCFGVIKSNKWRVDLYAFTHSGEADEFATVTDEKIEWFKVNSLPSNILDNLNWMIPMAIESLIDSDFKSCLVDYN